MGRCRSRSYNCYETFKPTFKLTFKPIRKLPQVVISSGETTSMYSGRIESYLYIKYMQPSCMHSKSVNHNNVLEMHYTLPYAKNACSSIDLNFFVCLFSGSSKF